MRITNCTSVVLIAVLAGSASGKEENKKPLDVREELRAVADEIAARASPPQFRGIEDRLAVAWRTHVQRRIKEVRRAFKTLQQERRFQVEPETGEFLRVRTGNWNGVVAQLTKAYSGLATARAGYSKVNTSPDTEIRRWDKANEPPDLKQRTPSEIRAGKLSYEIGSYRARGRRPPVSLVLSYERCLERAADERRQLEAEYDTWKRERKQAVHGIKQHAEETGREAQRQMAEFTALLKRLQRVCAALMEADEAAFKEQIAEYPDDEILARQAKALLTKIASGRRNVERYEARKSSVWSSYVRQKWLLHRNKLRSALSSARARKNAADARTDHQDEERKPGEADK